MLKDADGAQAPGATDADDPIDTTDPEMRRALGLDERATDEPGASALTSDDADASDAGDENAVDPDGEFEHAPPEPDADDTAETETDEADEADEEEIAAITAREFPFTLTIGAKKIVFPDQETFDAWAEDVDNRANAWAKYHERNRALNEERRKDAARLAELESVASEHAKTEAERSVPVPPPPFDTDRMNPASDKYDPNSYGEFKAYLSSVTAYSAAMAKQAAAPPVGETVEQRRNRLVSETEDGWWAAHADLAPEVKARIDTEVTERARTRIAEQGFVTPADVRELYGLVHASVTGTADGAPAKDTPNPSDSVTGTERVIRETLKRAKGAPKKSKQAPADDQKDIVDPLSDDVPFAVFKQRRLARKISLRA